MGELRPTILRARIQPWRISTGVQENLYIAGGGNRTPYRFGGQDYKAGVASLPKFRAKFGWDENGWTGGVIPSTGEINWSPSLPSDYLAYSTNYHWKDAPILVEVADEKEDASEPTVWTTILSGTIATMGAGDGFLVFTIGDLSAKLDKPILSARFAGTGGLEGPAEAKGRIKRRTWGAATNIECRILDKANNIWEFGDPAFQASQVFSDVRDMGRSAAPAVQILAWQGSVAATFAALQSSIPVPGSGVVAPSIQCLKWWTTPVGPLTIDIIGETGAGANVSPAYLAQAILASVGLGVTLTDAERNLGQAARPMGGGIHVGDDRFTTAQALDQLLLGVSLVWVLDPSGVVRLRPISLNAPVAVLPSLQVSRTSLLPPTKTRRVGYRKNNREQGDGEIAAVLETGGDVVGGQGSNELLDTQFGASWSFTLGLARGDKNANGGYASGNELHYLEVSPSTSTQRDAISGLVAIQGSTRYFFEGRVQRGTTLGSGSRLVLLGEWVSAGGVSLGPLTGITIAPTDLTAGDVPKPFQFSEVSPSNAAFVRYRVRSPALASSSGTFRVEAPRVSATGQTPAINGPTTKEVKYDYTVTALSGELPTNLVYNLLLNSVAQTTGVTWTYLVQSGTVNGFTIDDGAKSMTGSGAGTLTISSVGTDSATVKITATNAAGYTATITLTVTRNVAAAPVSGGGGGGGGALATGSVTGSTSSSTFADASGTISATQPAGKTTANVVANLTNSIDPIGASQTETVEWKLERNISGTWTQIGSTVTSQAKERFDADLGWIVTDGNVTLNINDTGLTAGASYDRRISARRSSGSHVNYLSGPITITAP